MSGGRTTRKKPAAFVHLQVTPDYPKEEQDKLTLLHFLKKMGCNGLLVAPWRVFDHPSWQQSSSGNRMQDLKAVSRDWRFDPPETGGSTHRTQLEET